MVAVGWVGGLGGCNTLGVEALVRALATPYLVLAPSLVANHPGARSPALGCLPKARAVPWGRWVRDGPEGALTHVTIAHLRHPCACLRLPTRNLNP